MNSLADDWEACDSLATVSLLAPDARLRKRKLAVMGMGMLLSLIIIAALGVFLYPTRIPAVSSDRGDIEMSLSGRNQRKANASPNNSERARVMEEGFTAAFPFSTQSRSVPEAVPSMQLGSAAAARD